MKFLKPYTHEELCVQLTTIEAKLDKGWQRAQEYEEMADKGGKWWLEKIIREGSRSIASSSIRTKLRGVSEVLERPSRISRCAAIKFRPKHIANETSAMCTGYDSHERQYSKMSTNLYCRIIKTQSSCKRT